MKINKHTVLFIAAFFMLTFPAFSFDFAAYKNTTLPKMLNEQSKEDCRPTKPEESIYSAYAHKYRFLTKFTKELRKIHPDIQLYLDRYAKSIPSNKDFIKLYKHAFLVKSNGKDYWVPVQENLLPYMGNELKVGQDFELFVAVIGKTKNQCVFLATEFKVKS